MKIRRRRPEGQGLIEAIAAAIVLIPLSLAMFDFMVLIIANSMNDTMVKNAARAAASQDTEPLALQAAQKSMASYHGTSIVNAQSLILSGFDYDINKGSVTAQTTMTVHLPMPFPGLSEMTFHAQDVEPIVNFKPN